MKEFFEPKGHEWRPHSTIAGSPRYVMALLSGLEVVEGLEMRYPFFLCRPFRQFIFLLLSILLEQMRIANEVKLVSVTRTVSRGKSSL